MRRQGLSKKTGVVLRRNIDPEGNIRLLCLFRGEGATWLYLPGAARGKVRFGGTIEPLVWGEFNLYRGNKKIFLKEVTVKRDFWPLRKNRQTLKTAIDWCMTLNSFMISDLPMDEVLPVFYWSLDLLEKGGDPDALSLRFFWKLLNAWGVAPSLSVCSICGAGIKSGRWKDGAFLCPGCSAGRGSVVDSLDVALWITASTGENFLKMKKISDYKKDINTVTFYLKKNINLLK